MINDNIFSYTLKMIDERIVGSTTYPPYCLLTCDEKCIQHLYHYGFIVSIIFSVITSLVGLYNVVMHYINFNNPYFQSKIISIFENNLVILLMPPIYAITSTLSFLSVVKNRIYRKPQLISLWREICMKSSHFSPSSIWFSRFCRLTMKK